jgi:hypothetical protein
MSRKLDKLVTTCLIPKLKIIKPSPYVCKPLKSARRKENDCETPLLARQTPNIKNQRLFVEWILVWD